MLESLFSAESILSLVVTLAITVTVTIRTLKLNIRNKSHTVNGGGNVIEHKEYNVIMQGVQKEFRNISYFLGVSLLFLIPYCIDFINTVLYFFSVVAPYFCVDGISFVLLKRGFINRLLDCIYILSMVLNVYLSRLTAVNSYYFMQGFDGLYDKMLNSLLLLLYSYGDMESLY
ncbi:TPA: hypothetical protein ACPUGO_004962 [Klebsiella pneumoniae]